MRRIAFLLAVIALAACNNDSTSPNGTVIGSYSLRTINGNTLPYTFSNNAVLVSDRLTLNSDGSYFDVASFSNSGQSTEQGTWSINNNLITFEDQTDGIRYSASLSGNVLTETFNNTDGFSGSVTEVYQKD
jgi:lipocalin-like protein